MATKYPGLPITQGDKQQAMYKGLLNVGANMGGYSDRPMGLLNQFTKGGKAFSQGYEGALNQTKQDQLSQMQARSAQAELEAQKLKIEEMNRLSKIQEMQDKAKQNWLNISSRPDMNSRPDGSGMSSMEALQAYQPEKLAEAQIEAMYPTLGTSKPSSPIQNFAERQRLVIEYGKDSPEVKRFDSYVRAIKYQDVGGSILEMTPETPASPTTVAETTLAPEQTPEVKGLQAKATAIGAAVGAEAGDAQARLSAAEAAMPQLESAVDELKKLGEDATYTISGKVSDFVRKQSGGEIGGGAVARATYIAHVKNNVLPLLRQTFGAAFTAAEGDSLLATLGDPDMSPPEKNAVLDAFISDKIAGLETLRRQTGAKSVPQKNGAASQTTNGWGVIE